MLFIYHNGYKQEDCNISYQAQEGKIVLICQSEHLFPFFMNSYIFVTLNAIRDSNLVNTIGNININFEELHI